MLKNDRETKKLPGQGLKWRILLGGLFLFVSMTGFAASQAPLVSLLFGKLDWIDKSQFATRDRTKPFFFNYHQGSTGRTFQMLSDIGSNFDANIRHDLATKRDSIQFKLMPYDDGCMNTVPPSANCSQRHPKDKVQLTVVSPFVPEALRVDNGVSRFVSLDMKLDRNFQLAKGLIASDPYVLLFQAWQCCNTPPPFSVLVEPASPTGHPSTDEVKLVFVARDDSDYKTYLLKRQDHTYRRPFYKWGRVLHTMSVNRNEWGRFVFQLQPSFNGDGKAGLITFWHNGVKRFQFQGDWGFQPDLDSDLQKDFRSPAWIPPESWLRLLSIELDIYRSPFVTTTQIVEFSRVKYGNTYDSVVSDEIPPIEGR